jgi:tRNA(fMet)-specific endonuclease VapC
LIYILDTNVVIALLNDRPKHVRPIFETHIAKRIAIHVPTIVLFELWFGIWKSARFNTNVEKLARFVAHSGIGLLSFDEEDARVAGEVRTVLERRGTPIGPYDLLIAAQTLRRDAVLVTSNGSEFGRVNGLTVEDWALLG